MSRVSRRSAGETRSENGIRSKLCFVCAPAICVYDAIYDGPLEPPETLKKGSADSPAVHGGGDLRTQDTGPSELLISVHPAHSSEVYLQMFETEPFDYEPGCRGDATTNSFHNVYGVEHSRIAVSKCCSCCLPRPLYLPAIAHSTIVQTP